MRQSNRVCEKVIFLRSAVLPDIKKRIDGVYEFRVTGGEVAKTLSNRSHQFRYRKEAKNNEIILQLFQFM